LGIETELKTYDDLLEFSKYATDKEKESKIKYENEAQQKLEKSYAKLLKKHIKITISRLSKEA
jgi:hypothetical protein